MINGPKIRGGNERWTDFRSDTPFLTSKFILNTGTLEFPSLRVLVQFRHFDVIGHNSTLLNRGHNQCYVHSRVIMLAYRTLHEHDFSKAVVSRVSLPS